MDYRDTTLQSLVAQHARIQSKGVQSTEYRVLQYPHAGGGDGLYPTTDPLRREQHSPGHQYHGT